MRKPLVYIFIISNILLIMLFSLSVSGQSYKLISYNIKYDNVKDTVNSWEKRKNKMVSLIEYYHPAFLGIQEGLLRQVEFMDESLPAYSYIGVGREDGQEKGEFSAIFYDATKFKVINSSTFWLSESPKSVSVGWDAALERICTYGLFEDLNTKERIRVFNTHFDHRGQVARKESATLIIKKIQQINEDQLPLVLMGDFNATPDEGPIQILKTQLNDALEISEEPLYGPPGTFNGFDDRIISRRIDYFFTDNLHVLSYTHIDDRLNTNRHISDHLPVLIIVKTKSSHK